VIAFGLTFGFGYKILRVDALRTQSLAVTLNIYQTIISWIKLKDLKDFLIRQRNGMIPEAVPVN
jgi:hypothetical protein